MSIPDSDIEYEEYVIEEVELDRDASPIVWRCRLQHGFSISLERRPGAQPRVGQDVRVYGLLPDDVRGVVLDGKVAFYHSPDEWKEKLVERERRWLADLAEIRQAFAKQYDESYAALPEPYRKRLDRLREEDPERRDLVDVREMMISNQAVMFAEMIRAVGGGPLDVDTLRGLPTMRKLTDVVGWMLDDANMEGGLTTTHTKKSLDTALRLARLDLAGEPDAVAALDGAGETVQDRHLDMTDCPFPEELKV